MRVTSLLFYPVKSMGGVAVDTAGISLGASLGIDAGDLIDASSQKFTAREVHLLLRFRAEVLGEHTIRISERDARAFWPRPPSA